MGINIETSLRSSVPQRRTFLLRLKRKWKFKPKSSAALGAITGAAAVPVAFLTYFSAIITTGVETSVNVLLALLSVTMSIVVIAVLVAIAITLLKSVPKFVIGIIIASLLVSVTVPSLLLGLPFQLLIPIAAIPIVLEALLGAAIGAVVSMKISRVTTSKKVVLLVLAFTVAANAIGIAWLAHPGTDDNLVENVVAGTPPSLDMPNPSLTGRYSVQTWFYGSGTDKRRPEYGKAVQLRTDTVDASPFLPKFTGLKAILHQWFWGFDLKHLPLNGRVWFPVGDGAFPLALIVHGGHLPNEFSDPGYAYLGELLASRGFITVSVDENFLNGPWLSDRSQDYPVRAWLLLQHLQQWRNWNASATNPFYNKVDMSRIALMGHSRGGEAIAIAAVFNTLPCYPDNANIKFNFNFAIKSLVAIAPSDESYKPAGRSVLLEDINYLVLHGSHDGDISSFQGIRQYQRLKFSEGQNSFKSALYIYRANHGQFNTVWGRHDMGPIVSNWFLNLKPLLNGDAQRQIAKVYISAFLEATLHRQSSYLPLFQDYRTSAQWLPRTIYLKRFQSSSDQIVSHYQEDINPTTTSVLGGTERADNLKTWREEELDFHLKETHFGTLTNSKQDNNAVVLAWGKTDTTANILGPPSYTIHLPDVVRQRWQINPQNYLIFDLANSTKELKLLNLSIELTDSDGTAVSLPLSRFAPVQYPLKTQLFKLQWLEMLMEPSEILLQSYNLPLADFVQVNPQFAPSEIETIRFRFDCTEAGEVVLDEIGFRSSNS